MIGILICGRITGRPLEVGGGDYDRLYTEIFTAADPEVDIRFYYAMEGDLPKGPDECDGWIIGGSRTSVTADEPWLDNLMDFIRAAAAKEARMVGLCFGHQAIAHALGGTVGKATAWTTSVQPLILEQQPWFPGGLIPLQAMHEDIVIKLPERAEVVGSGTSCDVPAFMIGDHIFTIQYHPEIGADLAEALMDKVGDEVTPRARSSAMASLEIPTDRIKMARWILRFLSDQREQPFHP
jgi:GMP synthase-like glutamine amidotransferase